MSTASYNEETSDKILRQVEFYFSDSNLPKDEFLRKLVQKSKDGLVNLNVVCSFSRMRSYLGLGNLKADDVPDRIVNGVAEILRKSDTLKVSNDGKKIGRLRKLANPEKVLHQVDGRTVAASPLPYDANIEDVQAFFGQYGKVNSVRLPKLVLDKNCFCGTALIEFSSEEQAKNILNLKVVYDGMEVELKPKREFDVGTERKTTESVNSDSSKESNLSINDLSYEKGLVLSFTLEERVNGGPVEKYTKPVVATDGLGQSQPKCNGNSQDGVKVSECIVKADGHSDKKGNKKKKLKRNIEEIGVEDHSEINKKCKMNSTEYRSEEREGGTAVEIDAADQQNTSAVSFQDTYDVRVKDLEDILVRFGKIKHIHFDDKMDRGHVCFEESNAAIKARAAADFLGERGIMVKRSLLFLEALTGEAEKEYWRTHLAKS